MILAVDVNYRANLAIAAGVLFKDWSDPQPVRDLVTRVSGPAPYEPGRFYRRELPCILALLKQLDDLPEIIVVDGYVYLDSAQSAGLGQYLYQALQGQAAVVGVAKTRFKDTPAAAAVYRSTSRRPLYVTAAGIGQEAARRSIGRMHGRHRLPTLLKRVDQLCRQSAES